jgi:hypothetical protein
VSGAELAGEVRVVGEALHVEVLGELGGEVLGEEGAHLGSERLDPGIRREVHQSSSR